LGEHGSRKFKFYDKELRALEPPPKRGSRTTAVEYTDTDISRLKIAVTSGGLKVFYFRYSYRKKKRFIRLGEFPGFGIGEARKTAQNYIGLLAKDIDPGQNKERFSKMPTMGEHFERYLKHAKIDVKKSWYDAKSALISG
jgi:hypothetical protein